MKAIKKFLVLMMSAILCLGVFSFAGCDEESDFIIDETKTQVYVFNFSGGFGVQWMDELIKRFEEDFKDYEGVDGKVGVQVVPDYQKVTGTSMTMAGNKNDVLFTEGINYFDFVSRGDVLDLTEMVNEKLTQYGETRSIMDKIPEEMQSALNVDGKIYMIPHYAGYNGITLDVDLMDEKGLFLGKDGEFLYKTTDACDEGDTTGESGELSTGPDGKFGTYDDGLPATYEEFFALVEELDQSGVDAFAWSGQHQWYTSTMMVGMAANAMGPEYASTLYNYNKTNFPVVKTNTIQVDSTAANWSLTYETETENITEANGYEVFRHPGFLTALAFIERIVDNRADYAADNSFTGGVQNTDIQAEYLLSRLDSTSGGRPIAMLIEGCWWEQEADLVFKDHDDQYGVGRMDRRLRFLPFPHINDDYVGQGQVMLEANNCYGFINSSVPEERKDLALKFLQYCNTDASLREYSRITNTTKALKYELTEEDRAAMSYFGNSLMDIQEAEDTVIVYPVANNAKFREQKKNLGNQDIWVMNASAKTATTFFKGSPDATAADYFRGMLQTWQNSWGV